MERIYLSSPHMGGEEINYIKEAFDTNWIAPLGPNVNNFEKELSEYVGIKSAAALSAGTAAIHMALRAVGVKEGDKVFCSSLTFSASANPIIYEKAIPVFIDSEMESWNMCHKALEKAFKACEEDGKLPKAVIVVNLYGQSADMDRILEVCSKYGVTVIEDAAESLGATYKGKYSGTLGEYGIYSFNGNKIITTSGGGMLISNNEEKIAKVRFWATQARDTARHYEHTELGYNYRMSNIVAGIGRGQLKVLKERVNQKKHIYETYKEAFKDIKDIEMMPICDYGNSNYWLSCITLKEESKVKSLDIILALEKENIESRPIWKPMHMQPYYKEYEFFTSAENGSVSEDIFNRGVCLPSDTKMSEEQINRTELTVKYEKQDLNAVEYKSTNVLRGADLKKDYVIIKDTAGRDVTKEAKVKFACVEDKNLVTSDGKVSGSATVNKEYTIRILDSNDVVLSEQTIKVVSKLDNTFLGYTLTLAGVDVDTDAKYADITPNSKVQLGTETHLTLFYIDALGKEKKVDAKNAKVTLVDKKIVTITSDNKIKGLKEGHAVIKVVYGSMEQEIEIEVTKDAVAELDLTVSDALLANVDIYAPIEIKNNNKLIGVEDEDIINSAKVQFYNPQSNTWYTVDSRIADGQVWLNGSKLKDGRAKLVLGSKYGSKEYEFDIKVQKAAKISSYLLEARKTGVESGSVDTIDLNNDGKSESATLHVYAIDENGLRIGEVTSSKIHVTKMNGDKVKAGDADLADNVIDVKDVFGQDGSVLFDVEYSKFNGGTDTAQITLTVKNSYDKAVSVRASQEEYTTSAALSLADVLEFYYGNTYTQAVVTDVVAYDNTDKNQTRLSMTAPLTKGYHTIHVQTVKVATTGEVYTVDDNVSFTIK